MSEQEHQTFLQGLRTDSTWSVGTSLVVPLALFTVLCGVLTPGFMRGEQHQLLYDREHFDTDNYVTHRAQCLAESEGTPLAVFLGSSSMRRALWSDNFFAEVLPAPIEIYNLSNDGATFYEMLALTDMIPRDSRGVLCVEVRPGHFTRSIDDLRERLEHPRLGFRSEAFDDQVQLAGIHTGRRYGVYVLDNRFFFLPRLPHTLKNLFRDGYSFPAYEADDLDRVNDKRYQDQLTKRVERLRMFDAEQAHNERVLRDLIRRVKQRTQLRIVLLEATITPEMPYARVSPDFQVNYETYIRKLATETQTTYVSLNQAASLTDEDFMDPTHLGLADARRRYSHALAEYLTQSSRLSP